MKWLTMQDVLQAHAQFGQLDKDQVRSAMGPNWPRAWDAADIGVGIFK